MADARTNGAAQGPGTADPPGLPRRLLFGLSVIPYADSYAQIVDQVLAAEEGGLDLVGIQEHPYQRRSLDTLLLIADLLARTRSLTFFSDVANLQLRHPANSGIPRCSPRPRRRSIG